MSIKRVDPNARFRLICEKDDSLVNETPDELKALADSGEQTRYNRYTETLDESILKFADGAKPTYFIIRCLKNAEVADIQDKYYVADVVNKTVGPKSGTRMFLEIFNVACDGMENDGGKLEKVTADDLGFAVAVAIGAAIYSFTALGRHLKK